MYMNTKLAAIFLTLILAACGGGSGGSEPSVTGPSPGGNHNKTPTVDAGPDLEIEVRESATIRVRVEGFEDITAHSASRVAGSVGSISMTNLHGTQFSYSAPDSIDESSVQVEYEFTYEDSAGNTASDSVIITIYPRNNKPTVYAGDPVTLSSAESFIPNAMATDTDGHSLEFQWVQTAGSVNVTFSDASLLAPEITLPEIEVKQEITLTLIATDSRGDSSEDTLLITIMPENVPDLAIHFPPANGYYTEGMINAYGTVSAKEGSEIQSVIVNAEQGSIQATVFPNGRWRAENVVLPTEVESIVLTVTAEDSEGRVSSRESVLVSSIRNVGGGTSWKESKALDINADGSRLWILSTGFWVSDIALMPVSVVTGERGPSVTDFSDPTIWPNPGAHSGMVYDEANDRFYLATSPADGDARIYAVARDTGMQRVISGPEVGEGAPLLNPTDIALGPNGMLLVAENDMADEQSERIDGVVMVDPATGNRTPWFNYQSENGDKVAAPIELWWDDDDSRALVISNSVTDTIVTEVKQSGTEKIATVIAGEDVGSGPSVSWRAGALTMDEEGDRAFLISNHRDLIRIDLFTGERTLLAESIVDCGFSSSCDIRYDENRDILYVLEGSRARLYVVDPQTGEHVILSGD